MRPCLKKKKKIQDSQLEIIFYVYSAMAGHEEQKGVVLWALKWGRPLFVCD